MNMREKLIELLRNLDCEEERCEDCRFDGNFEACYRRQAEIMADHLIANGVTVRAKGEWVHDPISSYGVHVWFCSQCNGEVIRKTDYCPNCGADMRGEEDG